MKKFIALSGADVITVKEIVTKGLVLIRNGKIEYAGQKVMIKNNMLLTILLAWPYSQATH